MGEGLKKRIAQEKFESPAQEAVLNILVAADFVREKMDAICARYGIASSQFNVLRILRGAHPEGHSRREITRRMVERAPDVTRLVDRLEALGLVKRDRSKTDLRLSIARIAPKGLRLLADMEPALQEMQRLYSQRLNPRDCAELSRICENLYAAD